MIENTSQIKYSTEIKVNEIENERICSLIKENSNLTFIY